MGTDSTAHYKFLLGTTNMKITHLLTLAMAVTIGLCYTASSFAMGTQKTVPKEKSAALQQSYVWYDDGHPKTVWMNPELIAEFDGAASESAVKKALPNAREIPQRSRAVRIWQIDSGAEKAIAKVRTMPGAGKVSPVFHDGPSASGRMRAAPGNVIVYLDPKWDQARVDNWVARNKVEIVKKLEIGDNIYVIKTGPGLEALQTANALRQSGEVVRAFPDWWQETATR